MLNSSSHNLPTATPPSGSAPLGQIVASPISPSVAKLIGLVEAVCTGCRQTKYLSLSTPPGFKCPGCRTSSQSPRHGRSDIRCRGCDQTPVETCDDASAMAVAFTCVSCLMQGADTRPTCRRCLGTHWDAECEYSAGEAQAVHAARSASKPVMRPAAMPRCLVDGSHPPGSPWACRVTLNSQMAEGDQHPAPAPGAPGELKIAGVANAESGTSNTRSTNKPSRRGRPRMSVESRRAKAAARQRAYRNRQRTKEVPAI
jgi:hypothetical protein